MTQSKKILITEDDDSLRAILKKAILNEDYDVIEAKDGQEGIDMALQEHPDLILLDLLMPKVMGLKVLEKLRKDD
ncbi:response regulator [Patescibacteria group bacterium]|nr:response regulator [Patescibacteria group bacterium]